VPVTVFGRRHDLAVRSHSWSSRHAYPVAQWCARLHFHLCRVRVRMCRVSAVCWALCVCGPCVQCVCGFVCGECMLLVTSCPTEPFSSFSYVHPKP
jgi:hypothetical protein